MLRLKTAPIPNARLVTQLVLKDALSAKLTLFMFRSRTISASSAPQKYLTAPPAKPRKGREMCSCKYTVQSVSTITQSATITGSATAPTMN